MDQEIRNKIQAVMAEFASDYDLDILRSKKKLMIATVREKVIPFFTKRGITITTIGMFGGLEYRNKDIQSSIDNVFVAQQLKNVEAARLSAMKDMKVRMKEEGKAQADKAEQIAIGQAAAERQRAQAIADGIKFKANAEAESITLVAAALDKAASGDMFYKIKLLETENNNKKKWKGDVPYMMMGSGGQFIPMIELPEPKK